MTHKIRFQGVLPLLSLVAAAMLRQSPAFLIAPIVYALSLGAPYALERADALTFSRGRMLFNLVLALAFAFVGSAAAFLLLSRSRFPEGYLLPWPALFIVLQSCLTVDLCAVRRNALALLLEVLSGAAILLTGAFSPQEHALKLMPVAQAAVCAPSLIIALTSGEGARRPQPSARLLGELPSGILQTWLFPALAFGYFRLLPVPESRVSVSVAFIMYFVAAAVFYALLVPAGAIFRRTGEEHGAALALPLILCLAASLAAAVFPGSTLYTSSLGLLMIFTACVLLEYEAPTLPNLLSVALLLFIACMWRLPIPENAMVFSRIILTAAVLTIQRRLWADLFRRTRAMNMKR